MWTNNSFNFEVIVICFLSFIPWSPSVFKISCSRENTKIVRKIVQQKWLPILEKYQVNLPLECPFHPIRDIFGPQQGAKKNKNTCGFCGKSFFEEKYLDIHFETRHRTKINMAEDAVCFADYCDIMRCEVLVAQDSTFGDHLVTTTDIEIWSESTAYRTALSQSGPRDLAKVPLRGIFMPPVPASIPGTNQQTPPSSNKVISETDDLEEERKAESLNDKRCDKSEQSSNKNFDEKYEDNSERSEESGKDEGDEADSNATTSCEKDLVDSALPPAIDRKQHRISELQKLKANCKSEDLDKLKIRCEILVRDCIAGLLMHLSEQDFKEMEDELNRAVCWYLTCDRYWENTNTEPRNFPWGLVLVLVMVLSLGVCFCYYIIWVLFDSDDQSISSSSTQITTAHSSPTHIRHQSSSSVTSNYHHLPISSIQHHQQQTVGNLPSTIINQINLGPTSQSQQIQMQHQQQQQQHHQAEASGFTEDSDYNELGQSEHYIYVTYPPELKRRLLESCYNRTTRL